MALEEKMSEAVEKEYDSTFDGQEKVDNLLAISSDKFTLERKTVGVREIGLSEPVKKGRTDTIIGLTQTIAELGVLTPIHVMTVEQYDEKDPDSYKYTMLDGTRRLFGAIKSGQKEIEAVIWDFKDKDVGRNLALPLGLMINRHERRRWKEVWELYQILELQFNITPGTLEFLLQLEAGDAMKLKDCMLCDYDEVKEMLINGTKSLEQAYKQLQKLRKEENKLAKEEETGLAKNIEGADEVVTQEEAPKLSDDEVSSILELEGSISDEEIDSMSFEDLDKSEEVRGIEHQKVGERHPTDPAIRQATFRRDDFKCRCCGTGDEFFLPTLVYHHLIPVHCSGADTVENGLTLCDACHNALHNTERGDVVMSKEMFEKYDETQQKRIKLIMKYANIAIKANQLSGKKREQVKKESKIQHRMPNATTKETQAMYNASKQTEV